MTKILGSNSFFFLLIKKNPCFFHQLPEDPGPGGYSLQCHTRATKLIKTFLTYTIEFKTN